MALTAGIVPVATDGNHVADGPISQSGTDVDIALASSATVHISGDATFLELDLLCTTGPSSIGGYLYIDNTGTYLGTNVGAAGLFLQGAATDTINFQFASATQAGATAAGLFTKSHPPANAGAAGVAGTITWDSGFIYVCVAPNTWKRVAIATWP